MTEAMIQTQVVAPQVQMTYDEPQIGISSDQQEQVAQLLPICQHYTVDLQVEHSIPSAESQMHQHGAPEIQDEMQRGVTPEIQVQVDASLTTPPDLPVELGFGEAQMYPYGASNVQGEMQGGVMYTAPEIQVQGGASAALPGIQVDEPPQMQGGIELQVQGGMQYAAPGIQGDVAGANWTTPPDLPVELGVDEAQELQVQGGLQYTDPEINGDMVGAAYITPPDLQVELGVPSDEAQMYQYLAPEIQGEVQGGVTCTTPEIQVQGDACVASPEIQVQGGMQYTAPEIQGDVVVASGTMPPDLPVELSVGEAQMYQYLAPESQGEVQGGGTCTTPEIQVQGDVCVASPEIQVQGGMQYTAPEIQGDVVVASGTMPPDLPLELSVGEAQKYPYDASNYATVEIQVPGGMSVSSVEIKLGEPLQVQVQCAQPQVQMTYESQAQVEAREIYGAADLAQPQVQMTYESQAQNEARENYGAADLSVGTVPAADELNAPTANIEAVAEFAVKDPILTFPAIAYPAPTPVKATRLSGMVQHVPTESGEVAEVDAVVDGTLAIPIPSQLREVNVTETETIVPPTLLELSVPTGGAEIYQYGAPEIQGEMSGGVMYTTPEIQMQEDVCVASPEIQVQGGMEYTAPEIQVDAVGEGYITELGIPSAEAQMYQYGTPEIQGEVQGGVMCTTPEIQVQGDLCVPSAEIQVQGGMQYTTPEIQGDMVDVSHTTPPDLQVELGVPSGELQMYQYGAPKIEGEVQGGVTCTTLEIQVQEGASAAFPDIQVDEPLQMQVGCEQLQVQAEAAQPQIQCEQHQLQMTYEEPQVGITCEQPQAQIAAMETCRAPDLSVDTRLTFPAIAYPAPTPVKATRLSGMVQHVPTKPGQVVEVDAVVDATLAIPMQPQVQDVNVTETEKFVRPNLQLELGIPSGEAQIYQYGAPEIQGELQIGIACEQPQAKIEATETDDAQNLSAGNAPTAVELNVPTVNVEVVAELAVKPIKTFFNNILSMASPDPAASPEIQVNGSPQMQVGCEQPQMQVEFAQPQVQSEQVNVPTANVEVVAEFAVKPIKTFFNNIVAMAYSDAAPTSITSEIQVQGDVCVVSPEIQVQGGMQYAAPAIQGDVAVASCTSPPDLPVELGVGEAKISPCVSNVQGEVQGGIIYTPPEIQVQGGISVASREIEVQGSMQHTAPEIQGDVVGVSYTTPPDLQVELGVPSAEIQVDELPQMQVGYQLPQVQVEQPQAQMTYEQPQIGISCEQPKARVGAMDTSCVPDLPAGNATTVVEFNAPTANVDATAEFAVKDPVITFFATAFPTPTPVKATRVSGMLSHVPTELGELVEVDAVVDGTLAISIPSQPREMNVTDTETIVPPTLLELSVPSGGAEKNQYGAPEIQGEMSRGMMYMTPEIQMQGDVRVASPEIQVQGGAVNTTLLDLQVEPGVPSDEAQMYQFGAPKIQGDVQGGAIYTTSEIQVQGGMSVASPDSQGQGGMQYAAPEIQVTGPNYTTPDIFQYAAPETAAPETRGVIRSQLVLEACMRRQVPSRRVFGHITN